MGTTVCREFSFRGPSLSPTGVWNTTWRPWWCNNSAILPLSTAAVNDDLEILRNNEDPSWSTGPDNLCKLVSLLLSYLLSYVILSRSYNRKQSPLVTQIKTMRWGSTVHCDIMAKETKYGRASSCFICPNNMAIMFACNSQPLVHHAGYWLYYIFF